MFGLENLPDQQKIQGLIDKALPDEAKPVLGDKTAKIAGAVHGAMQDGVGGLDFSWHEGDNFFSFIGRALSGIGQLIQGFFEGLLSYFSAENTNPDGSKKCGFFDCIKNAVSNNVADDMQHSLINRLTTLSKEDPELAPLLTPDNISRIAGGLGDVVRDPAKREALMKGQLDISGMLPQVTMPEVKVEAKAGDIKGAYMQMMDSYPVLPDEIKQHASGLAEQYTEAHKDQLANDTKGFAKGLIQTLGEDDKLKVITINVKDKDGKAQAHKIEFAKISDALEQELVKNAPQLAIAANVQLDEAAQKQTQAAQAAPKINPLQGIVAKGVEEEVLPQAKAAIEKSIADETTGKNASWLSVGSYFTASHWSLARKMAGSNTVEDAKNNGYAPNSGQVDVMAKAIAEAYGALATDPDNKALFEKGDAQSQALLAQELGVRVEAQLKAARAEIDKAGNIDAKKAYKLTDEHIADAANAAQETFTKKDETTQKSPYEKIQAAVQTANPEKAVAMSAQQLNYQQLLDNNADMPLPKKSGHGLPPEAMNGALAQPASGLLLS